MKKWLLGFTCALGAISCRQDVDLVELAVNAPTLERVALSGEAKSAILSPLSSKISLPLELPHTP